MANEVWTPSQYRQYLARTGQTPPATPVPTKVVPDGSPHARLPPGAAMGTQLSLRLDSTKSRHEHWRIKAQRTRLQRQYVYAKLTQLWDDGPVLGLPLTITITRIGPRRLDEDNLAVACSAVRDAVADWLTGAYGTGQDQQEGLVWAYRQQRLTPTYYAVEIRVERPKGSQH
jgi:hypothetical protein